MAKEEFEIELTAEEYKTMLQDKTKENIALLEELAAEKNAVASMRLRAATLHEEKTLMQTNPQIAIQAAQMKYELSVADQFIKSKAFPQYTKEQIYVLMKAGQEQGLSPIQSLSSLYIVNGCINPYGKYMTARIVESGYKIEYLEETEDSVSVRVYSNDECCEPFDITEKVTFSTDQILKRSKAAGFAKKNKMRFHGLRLIISFHLAHLFSGVSDPFSSEYVQHEKAETAVLLEKKASSSSNMRQERKKVLVKLSEAVRTNDTDYILTIAESIPSLQLEEEYAQAKKEMNYEG